VEAIHVEAKRGVTQSIGSVFAGIRRRIVMCTAHCRFMEGRTRPPQARCSPDRRGRALGVVGPVLFLLAHDPAAAQYGSSYLTSFPPNDTYQLRVVGGSLAVGLAKALVAELADEPGVKIASEVKWGASLADLRRFDLISRTRRLAAAADFQIAVVMVGSNDRRTLRTREGERYRLASTEWKANYGRRVDDLLRALKAEKAAVYVVGMPIMKGNERREDMQMVNTILRERAFRRGIRYIDTWSAFADQDGAYNRYGPDLSGKVRRLRNRDGIHFTAAGSQKLAHFVAKEIRRDLKVARSQRDIPLAGNDQDLERIKKRREQLALARQFSERTTLDRSRTFNGDEQIGTLAASGYLDVKDDSSSVVIPTTGGIDTLIATGTVAQERTGKTIRLNRPPIPSAVIAHIQRRSQARQGRVKESAPLSINLSTGQTLLGFVTPAEEWSAAANQLNVPLTQLPYYKVLVKGERLPAKPNRADDFTWPAQGRSQGPAG